MIGFFRRILNSKIGMGIALGLLVVMGLAFALGDVANLGGGGAVSAGNVARVGKIDISASELEQRIRTQFQRAQQQQPTLTMEQFLAGDTFDGLLNQTIDLYALEQYARARGIGIDDDTIDAQIVSNPAFFGVSGSFDEAAMTQALAQEGLTLADYRANLANSLIVRQLVGPVGTLHASPQGVSLPYASLLLERRIGEATFVPASRFAPTAAPTDQQLQTFYTQQRRRYEVPEQRVVRYALIDQSAVDAVPAVTDAQIAEEYEKVKATEFAARETRRFRQVIAPSKEVADRIAAAVRSGTAIDQAARAAGLSTAPVTAQNKQQMASSSNAATADAAYAAANGAVVGPVQAPLGWVVLRVEGIEGSPERTLEQVTPLLRDRLAQRHREEALATLFNAAQDALNGGSTVTEFAGEHKLTVQTTPALTSNGTAPAQAGYQLDAKLRPVLAAAYQIGDGEPGQVVAVEEGKVYAIVDVASTVPATPPALASIRERVATDWRLAEGARIARDKARAIMTAVQSGKSLREASQAQGNPAPVQGITARRLEVQSGQTRIPPEVALLFSMHNGETKTLELPGNAGWMVIKLTKIERGDASGTPDLVNAVGRELVGALGADYVDILVQAARRQFPVTTNQAAVTELRNRLLGRASN
jgi:peptidyl-prolyl cis-trans isomerase D